MKTLILDVGGIFFHPAWRLEGMDHVSRVLGISKTSFKEALDGDKRSFYTGNVSETEYWKRVANALGVSPSMGREFSVLYRTYVRPIPETLALLPELSSRYKLITCNNCPKEWMDHRISIASLEKFFSEFFTSGYIGSLKPDEAMYSKVFAKIQNLDDAVYIDDNEEYVSFVQNKYTVKSLIYKNKEDLLSWIR